MRKGYYFMWIFDSKDLSAEVGQACKAYKKNYGKKPTICLSRNPIKTKLVKVKLDDQIYGGSIWLS